MTKIPWDGVFEMNVYEFFNYLRFCVTYTDWEAKEMEKWKQTH